MKKTILTLMLIAMMGTTANAAEIPRESAPQNATEDAIVIVENIIGDILDVVAAGDFGYTEACGYANTRVRKAVIAGETNGYGYGMLSAITRNALLDMHDMLLRPDAYEQAEKQLKVLLADLIIDVENGMNYEHARKEAYTRIYRLSNPEYTSDISTLTNRYYLDTLVADTVKFNRARKLLLDAQNSYVQRSSL